MNNLTIPGITAAFLTAIAFLSQTIKTIKTKQTKDISLLMYPGCINGYVVKN